MSQAGTRPRSREEMKQPETIEEELAIIAEAIDAGIDPFPPKKEPSRWARAALGVERRGARRHAVRRPADRR